MESLASALVLISRTPSHVQLLGHALRLLIAPRPRIWHASAAVSLTASRHLLHAGASVAAGAQLLASGKPGGQFLLPASSTPLPPGVAPAPRRRRVSFPVVSAQVWSVPNQRSAVGRRPRLVLTLSVAQHHRWRSGYRPRQRRLALASAELRPGVRLLTSSSSALGSCRLCSSRCAVVEPPASPSTPRSSRYVVIVHYPRPRRLPRRFSRPTGRRARHASSVRPYAFLSLHPIVAW